MKKLLGSGLSLVFILVATGAHAVWTEPPYRAGQVGINVEDAWINNGNQVSRIVSLETRSGQMPNERLCVGFGEGVCDFNNSKYRASVNALLGYCLDTEDIGCVEGLTRNGASLELEGEAGGATFQGDAAKDLPNGRTVSLWSDPSLPDVKFAVYASMVTNYHTAIGRFRADEFVLTVIPYTVAEGQFTPSTATERYLDSQQRWVVSSGGFPTQCAWVTETECGEWADFPEGENEIQVSLRVPSSTGSWFQGRLDNASFAVEKVNSRVNRMVVSGQPAWVPKVYVRVDKDKQTQAQRDAECPPNWVGCMPSSGLVNIRASYANTAGLIEAYRGAAKDTAVAIQQKWSFQVAPALGNKCLTDTTRVHGIVTTNSSVYQGTAPEFADGYLSYKVSGYHFGPDGEENIGTYRLIINSETAKCLYGFDSVPAQASVAVIGTDNQTVSTTTVGERNGWLYLDAAGFTFSQKNIKVAFSKPQAFTIAPFPGNTQSLTAMQKMQLKTFMSKSTASKNLTCKAMYKSAASKSLALKRSQAACALAKSYAPKAKVTATVVQTSKASEIGRVNISSK